MPDICGCGRPPEHMDVSPMGRREACCGAFGCCMAVHGWTTEATASPSRAAPYVPDETMYRPDGPHPYIGEDWGQSGPCCVGVVCGPFECRKPQADAIHTQRVIPPETAPYVKIALERLDVLRAILTQAPLTLDDGRRAMREVRVLDNAIGAAVGSLLVEAKGDDHAD